MSSINQYHLLKQRYDTLLSEKNLYEQELKDFKKKHDTVELDKKYSEVIRKEYWRGFFTLKDNKEKTNVLRALVSSPALIALIVNLRILIIHFFP